MRRWGTRPPQGGRPPFDPVLKFRMLVLQAMHGLSLAQTEFLVADRLSWMRFCPRPRRRRVPDANTLWDFREALIAAGALEALFARLDRAIMEAGYLPMAGQIEAHSPGQCAQVRRTRPCRASLRAPEGAHGPRDPHHRPRTRHHDRDAANMAYNMKRWCWLERRSLPA